MPEMTGADCDTRAPEVLEKNPNQPSNTSDTWERNPGERPENANLDTSSQEQKAPPYDQKTDPTAEPPSEGPSLPMEQFSVFSVSEKRIIILTGSLAGFFSPLSSSIYFPALNTIASALHVSESRINLTVTTYMIFQGLAPMMIAAFSDGMGRRPAYIACFTIYMAANLGLGLQNSYAALLVLRMLQSAGSSGTIALANGLVGDLVTSSERGQYIAFASLGSILGPSLSPIIGGLISQFLDWHWIFWFLLIFSAVCFVPLALFLPETCRKIVGDGSIPPPPLNWSLTDVVRHRRRQKQGITVDEHKQAELRKNYKFQFPNPIPTIKIIFDPASAMILVTTGLSIACFFAIMTGATAALHNVYGFNDIQIALMFCPIGAGGILSAFTTGIVVDWNYRRYARKLNMPVIKNVKQDMSNFPLERARIELSLPLYYLGIVSMIAYGWILSHKVSLAAPIILLFLLGYSFMAAFQILNVLMVDLYPGQAAAAGAANNLVRCEIGAAATAAIAPMGRAMGLGWAYTTLALIAASFTPLLLILMRVGMRWRQEKKVKQEVKEAQRKDREEKN